MRARSEAQKELVRELTNFKRRLKRRNSRINVLVFNGAAMDSAVEFSIQGGNGVELEFVISRYADSCLGAHWYRLYHRVATCEEMVGRIDKGRNLKEVLFQAYLTVCSEESQREKQRIRNKLIIEGGLGKLC